MAYTPPSRITVTPPAGANARRDPAVKTSNIIATLPHGTVWPVVGVARENFDPASSVLWAQLALDGQVDALGYVRGDLIRPGLPPLPDVQMVTALSGLNLRRQPEVNPENLILTMPAGSRVQVVGGAWESFDPASAKWWWLVDYNGTRGYAYSLYLGDSDIPLPTWKFGVCLSGVGNSDPTTWHEPTFQEALRVSRVEAVKLVPLFDLEKMRRIYDWLRSRDYAFVMVRLFWKPNPAWAGWPAAARLSAAVTSFVDTVRPSLEHAYANGVRYFEVHNEPNIPAHPTDPAGEGLGTVWLGPGEFAEWFSRVVDQLRQIRRDVYLGFPGLSPKGPAAGSPPTVVVDGQALIWDTDTWLSVCKPVIDAYADWLGVHCYWQVEGPGQFGLDNPDSGGMYWQRYAARFPGRLLFITEFSNNGRQIAPAVKGPQYAQYLAKLRDERALGAAFAYTLYWAGDYFSESWVNLTDTGAFRVNALPPAFGAGLQANPATAHQITVPSPDVWA